MLRRIIWTSTQGEYHFLDISIGVNRTLELFATVPNSYRSVKILFKICYTCTICSCVTEHETYLAWVPALWVIFTALSVWGQDPPQKRSKPCQLRGEPKFMLYKASFKIYASTPMHKVPTNISICHSWNALFVAENRCMVRMDLKDPFLPYTCMLRLCGISLCLIFKYTCNGISNVIDKNPRILTLMPRESCGLLVSSKWHSYTWSYWYMNIIFKCVSWTKSQTWFWCSALIIWKYVLVSHCCQWGTPQNFGEKKKSHAKLE